MLRRDVMILAGLAGLAAARGASAADAFPNRPVRLIIPFPPGGSADPIGRILASALDKHLGQNTIVENRSGAGGVIGTDAVAKATADGYTIGLVGVGSMTVSPHLLPDMPYNVARDLAPVAQVVGVPQLLACSNKLGASSLAEVVAKAKAKPGTLTYASSGNGTSPHLAMASLALRSGMELIHVPYRGVAPAITDLMAGRVDLMFADLPAMVGPARDGGIKALAVGSAERSAVLPDLPTVDEAGIRGVDVENWYGVIAPAATPADRIARLQTGILAALAESEARKRLTDLGVRIVGSDAATFSAMLKRESEKWAALIREAKITIE
ncbi:tripartite tricarboxylate transporter substrate binding protein [Roseomonas aerophila]|uniref:Tripartite tricarboxylate transporter substrate binding protein n=1 Tax=Teichococcus aerophilus TaxID=1224513 RepID=A0ABR7RNK3_9PROT|nr:tripartite tricarboxylate transporter substrate binding protein [Pseudoroseomonas aerophila]MBC9207637.1 tripartite tricarboxylate transporter substrate binding protein [Pseudoroseomonas aerophila]